MVQSHPGAVRYIILKILLLLGGVRSIYPRRLNKGFGSLLPHTYQMLPDEGRRLQRPKRCINNNQDEDSPNNTTHTKKKYSNHFTLIHLVTVCNIFKK